MRGRWMVLWVGFWALVAAIGAERINHEGRILGPQVVVTNSILFNTPEADAVLSSMQIFPVTSAWNEDISRRPLLANSDAMIAQIISDLATNRRTLRIFFEMNFAIVPDNQPLIPIEFFYYDDESDPSPYPIPTNLPVETWPRETGTLSLSEWQEDVEDEGGDRHAIMVMPGAGFIWETWLTKRTTTGWEASNGAKFDLKSNAQRTLGWTSGDAAGLPMFPALIRFDECERGMVEHAMRIVVKHSRREFIYPASHHASDPSTTDPNVPAMGQRVRLKPSFIIPQNWNKHEKAVLLALKKYGAMVADNGNFFSISAAPDHRWPSGVFDHLNSISITNFEVIQTTGLGEGPRSPGAPVAMAGADRSAPVGSTITLEGNVTFSGAAPTVLWKKYSGPGTVTFENAAQTNTGVIFGAPGEYVLMLSAEDGVHAVAYDAVKISASSDLKLSGARAGDQFQLSWNLPGTNSVVQEASTLPAAWSGVLTTAVQTVNFPITNGARFFRVRQP